jgi:hypothetical protein
MRREHSVWEQVTNLCLGPSVHNAMNDAVKIGARVDVVRDARGNDRKDIAGACTALIEPGEKPIATSEDQSSELALASIVGGFDIPVVEKEQKSSPLAIQIPEARAKGRLGWHDGLLPIDPGSKLVEDRPAELIASLASLLRAVTGRRRFPLNREQARDDAYTLKRDTVAGTCCFYETTPGVSLIPRTG